MLRVPFGVSGSMIGLWSCAYCVVLFFMLCATAGCGSDLPAPDPEPGQNNLLLGDTAAIQGTIDLPIQAPMDLNYKTKAEVLALRSQAVAATPNLVSDVYTATPAIFKSIEDKKPWWGIVGQGVFGPGPKANVGAAEESRFFLNPFLLVGANPAVLNMWDPAKLTEEDFANPDMPFCWEPSLVRLYPHDRLEQIVYDVSAFNESMTKYRDKLRKQTILPAFGLIAYNARDFNLNWIYWDPHQSIHVDNIEMVAQKPVAITQMIHCGNTCKIPGGCNNMSPAMHALDKIKYTALPARVTVLLWREKPADIHVKPDMVVYIDLK